MNEHFNIVDLFFEAAEKYPEKIAIVQGDTRITFGELAKNVLETGGYFQKKGIKKGDRVLIFVPMGIDLYRIVLALFKIGATAVFLDEWVSKKRLDACCKVAECHAFIAIPKFRFFAFFFKELRKMPIRLGLKYTTSEILNIKTVASDTALITFTTGSTGIPKAAKRTHGFLNEQFKALIDKINPQALDVDMPALPIVLLINLGAGCTSIIAEYKASKPESFQVDTVLNQWRKEKVNRFVSSPFLLKKISQYVIERNIKIETLEKIFTGGAPVFPHEAELYVQAFPKALIEIVYGSTEAEPISSILAEKLIQEKTEALTRGLNVGKPYHKAEVKIISIQKGAISCSNNEDLERLEVACEQIGEIIVSGSHVLREYFNNDEAIKENKIFIGEKCWHRTGDSGFLRGENLYLTGRCDSLIQRDDDLISPFMYENLFQSIMGIEQGTIIEINERILAVIEKNQDFDESNWTNSIVGKKLAFEEIRWLTKIPRDPRHNSKIDYARLKEMLQ